MLNQYQIEAISLECISIIYNGIEASTPNLLTNENSPFHLDFFNVFQTKLKEDIWNKSSNADKAYCPGKLNNAVNQFFFEKISHILCNGTKQEFKNLKISQNQQTIISDIITELKNSTRAPNLEDEDILTAFDNSPLDKLSYAHSPRQTQTFLFLSGSLSC